MTIRISITNEDTSWDREVIVHGVNPKNGFRVEGQSWTIPSGQTREFYIHEFMSVEVGEQRVKNHGGNR